MQLPTYGDQGLGFAGVPDTGIGAMLNLQDANRRRAEKVAKEQFPDAMISGDVVFTKDPTTGRLTQIGSLDQSILDAGVLQPSKRTSKAKAEKGEYRPGQTRDVPISLLQSRQNQAIRQHNSNVKPDQRLIPKEDDGGGSGGSEIRENKNGIKQKGRDLSGRQLLLEVPELDAARFIQPSEGATPAPGAGLNLNMPGVSAESFYKQPPVPFQVSDEAGPKFAMEMNPESLKASENAFSTDMTKYTPLLSNVQETEAKKEEPKPSRQRGSARQQEFAARPGNQPLGGEEPATADLVSPMYANAARNAARSGFLDAPISEGPMGRIRRRNAAVGLNAAGNIAKIDGKIYNVTKDQAYALTGGAGNTREGLDAIKNAATLYEAPGTQSMEVDTSNLAPGAKAAVDLAKTEFNQTMGVVPEAVQTAVASATDTSEPVIGKTLPTSGDAFKRAYIQRMSKKT